MKLLKNMENEQGFTLAEVLVAFAVVSIMLTAILGAMGGSFKTAVDAKKRTEAVALAEEKMEEARSQSVDRSNNGSWLNVNSDYSYNINYSKDEDDKVTDGLITFTVTVQWNNANGKAQTYQLVSVRPES